MKNITAIMETLLISELLKKYGIHPKKYMGQNFLIDKSVLQKIIKTADLSADDTVLEIGPGLGNLTIKLAKRVKRVIAVEKDRKMCEILKNVLIARNIGNVEIVNQDILKLNPQLYLDREKVADYKIVANLPYYITSPVIRKFLEAPHPPSLMILMIQKEVAQRICASPPDMSILSVAVQFYAEPKIIDYISKNCFYPKPKVDSAIIKIIPRPYVGRTTSHTSHIAHIDTEKFFAIVKMGFSAKRKMLKNNLPMINFEKIGLNPKVRAENLSIDDWLKVFHTINIP